MEISLDMNLILIDLRYLIIKTQMFYQLHQK